VRHTRSHLTVRLPTDYVQASTGLGYATTIHTAQGVSADTMHVNRPGFSGGGFLPSEGFQTVLL